MYKCTMPHQCAFNIANRLEILLPCQNNDTRTTCWLKVHANMQESVTTQLLGWLVSLGAGCMCCLCMRVWLHTSVTLQLCLLIRACVPAVQWHAAHVNLNIQYAQCCKWWVVSYHGDGLAFPINLLQSSSSQMFWLGLWNWLSSTYSLFYTSFIINCAKTWLHLLLTCPPQLSYSYSLRMTSFYEDRREGK